MRRERAAEICQYIKFILKNEDYTEEVEDALEMAIEALEREPKRGKWQDMATELSASFGRHEFVCPECACAANYFVGGSEEWWDTRKPNYCPNCGERMEGDGE